MNRTSNIQNSRNQNTRPKEVSQKNNTKAKSQNNDTQRRKVNNKINSKGDPALMIITVGLVLFGIMMVYSSSYYVSAIKGDSTRYLRSQTMYAIVGLIILYIASNFDYKLYYSRIPWALYIFSFVLVLYAGFFGQSSNGASRWISIFGFTLQPSEIAKVAIILLMPYQISTKPKYLNSINGHIKLLIPTAMMGVIVAKENLSTAIIIFVIGVGVLFLASPRIKEFILLGIAAIGGMLGYLVYSAMFSSSENFRGGRFLAWRDPFKYAEGKGYQIIQSLYAVSSGGFFGLGLGKSRQKLSFIPEAHNDIIFAIICEELGFFGATILLLFFVAYIWRTFEIGLRTKHIFPTLICSGIGIMIATQVIINVAVVTNTIPNTGIPMPFISSGGTALVIAMGLTGIVLNISKSVDL